ncbi:MAG: hypothetical protein DMD91_20570 [Candidatus Rokuibacteriota bacterium]|nr:MAG: hypothetical protein DMD91_20570 [Candidatus Rokubacteria bacterium]
MIVRVFACCPLTCAIDPASRALLDRARRRMSRPVTFEQHDGMGCTMRIARRDVWRYSWAY